MIPFITAIAVAGGLCLDSTFPGWGHWAADAFVALCFLLVYRAATGRERRNLLVCVVIATAGEVFLCFGWGLYEYRYENIPVFVPLGHAMIFQSGCRLAPLVPPWTWKVVLTVVAPAVLTLAWLRVDTAGIVWFTLFFASLVPRNTRNLYATMLVMAYCVEVCGTAVGSWWWFFDVPWLSLVQANPPLCGGVFYCILDLLVLTQERLWRSRSSAPLPPGKPELAAVGSRRQTDSALLGVEDEAPSGQG
jgi:hypothetical protein